MSDELGKSKSAGKRGKEPSQPLVFHAKSGLAAYDAAAFYGAPPVHGPAIRSELGFGAMFQARMRRVPEVEANSGGDLVLLMVSSAQHEIEVWMDGRHRGCVGFRRGDLVLVPPGMASRWCAKDGQASVVHLHVTAERLAQTLADEPSCTALNLVPGLAFRDPVLQRLMTAAARLDETDALSSLQVAAIGASALLQVLRHPPPGLGLV
ncbi:hypothetical protein [Pannonibacter sp. SL95]|jgi:hypothetical protein|uniref:hypothetical protein n=1 Tax=Pannonibacter sp. SL95 TaxID=2995153 RepID=UPI00227527D9|nr:hypothetical protein [Pannonibacter sp. SL95]MCY1707265.1 hypothetical protein [Pannonibacter sp. SL95]